MIDLRFRCNLSYRLKLKNVAWCLYRRLFKPTNYPGRVDGVLVIIKPEQQLGVTLAARKKDMPTVLLCHPMSYLPQREWDRENQCRPNRTTENYLGKALLTLATSIVNFPPTILGGEEEETDTQSHHLKYRQRAYLKADHHGKAEEGGRAFRVLRKNLDTETDLTLF